MIIQKNLIEQGTKARPGDQHPKKWIVIHETDNAAPSAGALNHAKYLKRISQQNLQYLSWHYTIDDSNIIQHIPDDEIAWHAGDGRLKDGGNMSGIGIEICVNKNSNFRESVKIAAKLVAFLLKKHKLEIGAVRQHNHFNGKDCPKIIRKYNFWNEFLKMCNKEFMNLQA